MERSQHRSFIETGRLPLCLNCGLVAADDHALCAHCATPLGIDPPQRTRAGDIQTGTVATTHGDKVAILIRVKESTVYVVFADGAVIDEAELSHPPFCPVEGLDGVSSLVAAALIARHQLIRSNMDVEPWTNAVGVLSSGRIECVRRAAVALSDAGLTDLLRVLPFSQYELAWWTAVSHARSQRHAAAAEALRTLPAYSFAPALPLIAELTRRQSNSTTMARDQVESLIDERLGAQFEDNALAMCSTWSTGLTADSLHRQTAAFGALTGGISTDLHGAVLGKISVTGTEIPFPADTPVELLDDLLDAGAVLHPSSLAALDGDARRYLRARTSPEALTEADLTILHFESELVRRLLERGGPLTARSIDNLSPEQQSAVLLARDGHVDAHMAQLLGSSRASLSGFLANPTADTLSDDFLTDPSLWRLVEGRLPPDAANWTAPDGSRRKAFLAWSALQRSVKHLFAADWTGASDAARQVLSLSKDETLRDEALNVMACAAWQVGNGEAARAALEGALSGRRNPALQVNLGVVAATADPKVAALEYVRLSQEGEPLALRTAAALRAAAIWLGDDSEWRKSTGDRMPDAIRDGLRRLVVDQLDSDTFRSVVALLAAHDSEWLATGNRLARSPHANSVAARVYLARAAGPDQLLDALSTALRDSTPEQWVVEMRDDIVNEAIALVEADFKAPAGMFLLAVFDKVVPITPQQRATLVPLLVLHLCGHIDPAESDLNDRFEAALASAEKEALSHGLGNALDEHYATAWARLASVRVMFSINAMRSMIEAYNRLVDEMRGIPAHRLDRQAVRAAFEPIRAANADLERSLQRLPQRRLDEPVVSAIRSLLDDARKLKQHISEVTA